MKKCIIIFSKHSGYCYQEHLDELVITDEISLNRILNLGFIRNDLQSLFRENNINYLTSYPVYFRELETKSPEYKNKKDAVALVHNICSEKGFLISAKFNCFDFNFPENMFK